MCRNTCAKYGLTVVGHPGKEIPESAILLLFSARNISSLQSLGPQTLVSL